MNTLDLNKVQNEHLLAQTIKVAFKMVKDILGIAWPVGARHYFMFDTEKSAHCVLAIKLTLLLNVLQEMQRHALLTKS